MYTVQKGENQHIILKPEYLKFINHSCSPNVFFDVSKMEIRALEKIQAGEELTFFYPSTEWKMEDPFDCLCGSAKCLSRIEGAYKLSADSLSEHQFSDFILEKSACRV